MSRRNHVFRGANRDRGVTPRPGSGVHTHSGYLGTAPTKPSHAMDTPSSERCSSMSRHQQLVIMLLAAAMRRRRERKLVRTVAVWRVILRSYSDDDDLEDLESGDNEPPPKRRRAVLPRRDYKASFWWNMLGETGLADPGSREARLFRRRFRIPYQFFQEVIKLVEEKKWFSTRAKDVAGRPCIPVELKVTRCRKIGRVSSTLCSALRALGCCV